MLTYARTLLETGDAEHLAIRLFAMFPVGPMKTALNKQAIRDSGGELLTLHAHSCYDFLPYKPWLEQAHSNAKFSKAASIQVGLARWEATAAGLMHPMTDRECTAVRQWALALCFRGPALPTPKTTSQHFRSSAFNSFLHLCTCASLHFCISSSGPLSIPHLCTSASRLLCISTSLHLCIPASLHLCIFASLQL